MTPGEVHARIRAEHGAIRGILDGVVALARRVERGERGLLGALRLEGEALLRRLEEHLVWEDRYLAPALRQADAWGEERVAKLDADHRQQREVLAHCLAAVRDKRRPARVVARTLADLVQLLCDDMDAEERDLLDGRVLRDDVVGLDVETG